MDYKYIEQLLARYWDCETSQEEEEILRSFFRQKEVPAHLRRYQSLFLYQIEEKETGLGDDFDAHILAQVEKPVVKAIRLTVRARLMPLYKAAATIAVLFVMGSVMQRSLQSEEEVVLVSDEYRQTTSDPQVAYEPTLPIDTVKKIAVDKVGKEKIK